MAPLLVLCEEEPTEATLEQERELIRNSGLPEVVQADLFGIAMLLAMRTFSRSVIRTIFREEAAMVNQTEELKELFLEMGALQVWMKDPRVSGELLAEAEAKGIARGKAEGEAAGIARGKTSALREMTLTYLTRQFGELPEALVTQITTADAEACQKLFDRAITAKSLAELNDAL